MSRKLLILICTLFSVFSGLSQGTDNLDSLNNETLSLDSTTVQLDTLSSDLNSPIFYDAKDSIIYDAINNKVLLYGTAVVKYDDIEVTSALIEYNFNSSTVSAFGLPDSLGVLEGTPIFKQGEDIFKPESMSFNFKSNRAYIKNVVTQNGEFYLISEQTKRDSTEKIYLGKTKITTCDKPNPHFHFQVNKAAVVPGDKIVSGPVVLKFRKIPTPLALPFAFFPQTKKRSKGIIIPAYGNAQSLGYFFRDLGYYIPINDNVDTRILGDVYTRGTWSLKNITAYKKRYGYSGRFNASYTNTKNGFKELDGYSENSDFFVSWTHTLDSKARPNVRFSASVNAGSSSNFRNNLNSSQENFLTNTFSSSVNWTRSGLKLFNYIPATLTINGRHSQNTSTRIVQFTLPQLTLQMNRIYPFKSSKVGKKSGLRKAIEGLGITNTSNFENRGSFHERDLQFGKIGGLPDDFRSGFKHQVSAATSIKAGVVSINPSFGFSSNIYRETLRLSFDPETQTQSEDTIKGINATYNWNASVSANTKFFGTFNFRKAKKVKAIRHSVTPSVGMSYRPKTGDRSFGFVGENGDPETYIPQQIGIFGTAANFNTSGSLNLGVINNLEMKVGSKDGEIKKVALLERLSLNTSRDFARDSINWSNLTVAASTRLGKKISVNYNSSYSFYERDSLGSQINEFLADNNNGLARLISMGGGITATLKGSDFRRKESTIEKPVDDVTDLPDELEEDIDLTRNEFVDFSVPWSANFTYTLNRRNIFNTDLQQDSAVITQSVIARGDLTLFEKWKVGYTTGYDLQAKEFTPTTLSLYWDLHCWEFSFDYIPTGIRKSFTIQLNVKAAALKDLKILHRGRFGSDLRG